MCEARHDEIVRHAARRVLTRAEPDFRAKLGGIVNVESLIELFGLIPDGANL
jgi:hypothetical protein